MDAGIEKHTADSILVFRKSFNLFILTCTVPGMLNSKLRCATFHKRYNLHKLSLKPNPIASNPLLRPVMRLQLLC